ncbi:MAG TPA: hypothetical protein VN132_09045 [Bdellovibrio sp.]|nr:hypothetical protein [Bdellovibrio sp.]
MKNIFLIVSILIAGSISQASTVCTTQVLGNDGNPLFTAVLQKVESEATVLKVVSAAEKLVENSQVQMLMVQNNKGWFESATGQNFSLDISMPNESQGVLTVLASKQVYPVSCVSK